MKHISYKHRFYLIIMIGLGYNLFPAGESQCIDKPDKPSEIDLAVYLNEPNFDSINKKHEAIFK